MKKNAKCKGVMSRLSPSEQHKSVKRNGDPAASLTFPLRQKLDQLVSGRLFGVLIVLLQSRADYCGGLVIARNLREGGGGERKIKETPALLDFRLMISRAHIVSGGSDSDDYH